jgi:hypothetical protein
MNKTNSLIGARLTREILLIYHLGVSPEYLAKCTPDRYARHLSQLNWLIGQKNKGKL